MDKPAAGGMAFYEERVRAFPKNVRRWGTAVVLGSGHVSHVHVYSPTTTVNRPHLLRGSSREEEEVKEESSALPVHGRLPGRKRDAARGTEELIHAGSVRHVRV